MEIETIVANENMNYIDAICYYCEINELEIESVTKLVSKPLKEKLKYDAQELNFMKKHQGQDYRYDLLFAFTSTGIFKSTNIY